MNTYALRADTWSITNILNKIGLTQIRVQNNTETTDINRTPVGKEGIDY